MKARILIVEDNPLDMAELTRTAGKATIECEVDTATTFDEAIAKMVSPDRYDIIITDYCLPGPNDGTDIARESHAPTVVMTGLEPHEVEARAIRAGALACLPKESIKRDPAMFDELIKRAQSGVHGRAATALEEQQERRIRDLEKQLATANPKRTGVLGVLDWTVSNRWLVLTVLAIVAGAVVVSLVLGKWPGE